MHTVIVILGPTASGKTGISLELARQIGGEIVSADSMQIYRYMDIGTAKPGVDEMAGIKHYLIDEVNPDQEFSVARYQQLAFKYIREIVTKGRIPIVVGGTGLYINSLIYNISFSETVSDWSLRESLKKEAAEKGSMYLHDMLREIDPEAAEKIHHNDVKRVIRAIEVFKHTKMPISYHQQMSRSNPHEYKFLKIGLTMERSKLYDKIEKRVDGMMQRGLAEEVKKLVELGYDKNSIAMQGLGYKEILSYLKGDISLEDALSAIKRNTRHYAKRQITWFRRISDVFWINVDEYADIYQIVIKVKEYIATSGNF